MSQNTNNTNLNLDPERLCDAAEAALKAASTAAEKSGAWTYPVDLMGTPAQPECLKPYTRSEIEQACAFLVRMGFLERPTTRRAA